MFDFRREMKQVEGLITAGKVGITIQLPVWHAIARSDESPLQSAARFHAFTMRPYRCWAMSGLRFVTFQPPDRIQFADRPPDGSCLFCLRYERQATLDEPTDIHSEV